MSDKNPIVAVVLPAYNEESTVRNTILEFSRALPEAEIYVVNNNSSDSTRDISIETLVELGNPGRVIDETRQGKGNALRRAFQEIDADVYLLSDADLTYPAERARDLISPVLDGSADMVVGDRHSGGAYSRENRRALHEFGNHLVQNLVNWLFNASLNDILSGYRAFSRKFVKSYPILVEGFQVETDMTLHALYRRFRILELPIEYRNRPDGSDSKLNTFSDGARILFAITQILKFYRPLLFFTVIAFVFVIAGLIASIPVFDDWFTMRYIEHVPLAILASALEIVAIVMLGVGLILDSVAHHHRLEYERRLLDMDEGRRSTP